MHNQISLVYSRIALQLFAAVHARPQMSIYKSQRKSGNWTTAIFRELVFVSSGGTEILRAELGFSPCYIQEKTRRALAMIKLKPISMPTNKKTHDMQPQKMPLYIQRHRAPLLLFWALCSSHTSAVS